MEEEKLDHKRLLWFCACCFASKEDGSWNHTTSEHYCLNCGARGGAVRIPFWAIESIRNQASWVGKRYYPNQEDKEHARELKYLRALPASFPGRITESDKEERYRWWVKQTLPAETGSQYVSTMVNATSAEDALEASRFLLPYIPAEALTNGK